MRLAAGRGQELESLGEQSDALATFRKFNHVPEIQRNYGGLSEDTAVVWTVVREGVRHRVHWTGNASGVFVEEDTGEGEWQPSVSQTTDHERFPIRIFSQGQISDMAGEHHSALLNLIDAAAGLTTVKRQLEEARASYYAIKANINQLSSAISGREESIKIELSDTERKLKQFEDSGHTIILSNYRTRIRQRTEIDERIEAANEAADYIARLAQRTTLAPLTEELFNGEQRTDQQAINAVVALGKSVTNASKMGSDAAKVISNAIARQREYIEQSDWNLSVETAIKDYGELVDSIKEADVEDPDQYSELVEAKRCLDEEARRLSRDKQKRDELSKKAEAQLTEITTKRRDVSNERRRFLTTTLANNDFVRIEIVQFGYEPRVIEQSLREMLNLQDERFEAEILAADNRGGIVADLLQPDTYPNISTNELEQRITDLKLRIDRACRGQGDFHGRFNNYLETQFKRTPEFLNRFWTWFPEDGLRIRYSRRGDGKDFNSITQASPGQKAAAMLAFLLAYGDEPIVLDQPEDDLDNELIYELVVRQMRENKLRRQMIVVTHNPNIVVNGDAELIHTMHFEDEECAIDNVGSLQESVIRENVCRVLEGGVEAFQRRYNRLGSEVRTLK